jgi:predicted transposase/invertase (TIGR01784 family)
MTEFKEKYINPFTDYGFKKLFGEEPNKDLLLDFLNELLKEEQGTITELTYLRNENLGTTELNRKAIFDLYCTNERGERFIVELQKTKQKFFKDRTIYYSTFPIQEQAKKGSDPERVLVRRCGFVVYAPICPLYKSEIGKIKS